MCKPISSCSYFLLCNLCEPSYKAVLVLLCFTRSVHSSACICTRVSVSFSYPALLHASAFCANGLWGPRLLSKEPLFALHWLWPSKTRFRPARCKNSSLRQQAVYMVQSLSWVAMLFGYFKLDSFCVVNDKLGYRDWIALCDIFVASTSYWEVVCWGYVFAEDLNLSTDFYLTVLLTWCDS